jgi:hypothetical protein
MQVMAVSAPQKEPLVLQLTHFLVLLLLSQLDWKPAAQ